LALAYRSCQPGGLCELGCLLYRLSWNTAESLADLTQQAAHRCPIFCAVAARAKGSRRAKAPRLIAHPRHPVAPIHQACSPQTRRSGLSGRTGLGQTTLATHAPNALTRAEGRNSRSRHAAGRESCRMPGEASRRSHKGPPCLTLVLSCGAQRRLLVSLVGRRRFECTLRSELLVGVQGHLVGRVINSGIYPWQTQDQR
jgi:hypothetical protein